MLSLFAAFSAIAPRTIADGYPDPKHAPLTFKNPVQDKNFFFLSAIEADPKVVVAVSKNKVLTDLLKSKRATLNVMFKEAGHSPTELCFTPAEIEAAERAILEGETGPAIANVMDNVIAPSGTYYKDKDSYTIEMTMRAWRTCAEGINNAIRVYGAGEKGRSTEIDGISNDPKSLLYQAMLHNIYGVVLLEDAKPSDMFFHDALRLALRLMEANRRDEAGRFEPMEKGENRAAYESVKKIDWSKFKYSVILVPGYGPEEQGVQLSPIGKLQIELAAKRYRAGLAPFIVVSGGYVHPKQTPFCEAIEMKRSLIKDFGIPARAIFIDPHARHTTTNMRNAARLIYRYGIPFDKPGLVTTNTFQSADIQGKAFHDRCQRVFGYQPFAPLKRLSPFDLEFMPKIESLLIDPIDPLDP